MQTDFIEFSSLERRLPLMKYLDGLNERMSILPTEETLRSTSRVKKAKKADEKIGNQQEAKVFALKILVTGTSVFPTCPR